MSATNQKGRCRGGLRDEGSLESLRADGCCSLSSPPGQPDAGDPCCNRETKRSEAQRSCCNLKTKATDALQSCCNQKSKDREAVATPAAMIADGQCPTQQECNRLESPHDGCGSHGESTGTNIGSRGRDMDQNMVDSGCKEKQANSNWDKGKEKEQSCCSKDGACSKPKDLFSPGPLSLISADNTGLDLCCSGPIVTEDTDVIEQHPLPFVGEDTCCTTDVDCECSEECLLEYASYLCSVNSEHRGDQAFFPKEDECCTGKKSSDEPKMVPVSPGSAPRRSFELPPRRPGHILQKLTAMTCTKHLNMAAEYASGIAPGAGLGNISSTVAASIRAAEASYVSNISNIIRRCFCRGPRRFPFPGDKSCCMVRRERKQSLAEPFRDSTSPCSKLLSTDEIDTIPAPPQRSPQTDVEKGNVDHLHALSLGVVGMTCVGCESKLRNTLNSYPGISEVRTSFILNRADMIYDPSRVSDPAEIISRVKKVTGFTCTILRTGLAGDAVVGERVHIKNLSSKGRDVIQQMEGVSHVALLRDATYEVFYNPQTVGIRDILEAGIVHVGGSEPCAELVPNSSSEEIAEATENAHWLWLIVRSLVATVFTIPVLVFAWTPVARYSPFPKQTSFISSSFALATVVQLLAIPIYQYAFRSLIYQKEIDMDVLVVLSITSAYIYSVVAFVFEVRQSTEFTALGHPIFETSSLLVTLILLGRLMAAWVKRKAQNAIKLGTSQSKSARVIRRASPRHSFHSGPLTNLEDGETEFIDICLLHYGDIIQGMASEQIVTDGIIVNGSAEIDEAHITGENVPVVRTTKAYVYAGSTIINGQINYRVTRLVSENTLSIVKRLVSTAASSRTKTLERADLAASFLTPIILVVACISFLVWVLVNRFARDWADTESSINALTHAIAILAISCPCALALAVPMVLAVSSTVAAKKGVIFKTGETLEVGRQITHVVFDKTGTLTSGELSVIRETLLCEESGKTRQEISRMAAMLTKGNRHPVSLAIAQYIAKNGTQASVCGELEPTIIVGKGVEIATKKGTIKGGSPSWLGLENHPKVKQLLNEALTAFCVTQNGALLAVYGLAGTIRPEAVGVLQKLRSKKITTHLLSGDNPSAVTAVAAELNFDMDNVRSLCQPDSKAAYIRNLQTPSMPELATPPRSRFWLRPRLQSQNNKVLFIGDGTNDAPALSQADLGICMTNATDIAADAADVGILSGSLHGLLSFLELSRTATRRIQINIAWAVAYNAFAVLFACGAFEAVGFRIQPSYAGAGEMVSLVPVIVVSLSLGFSLSWLFGRRAT
ncbi:cation transport ATPase [Paracoccidioides lutzii Pb01]|uniref:Cation transport ATPase n=1 Tax=Paracoccidioides lutzii (strain ATCC MYA-826 / Pb01) TaxID=502779 RepID=C1GZD7_PARBA|nr:cation transport ATPase [Paracoccidioides lutzii Pb01]EEH41960.1 cation transport ATPase [Paracoccidioides lutzii Pb01]